MGVATLDNIQVKVTDEQRRQLDVDGFFMTPVLIDEATLAGTKREFQRFWDEHIERAKKSNDPLTIEQALYRPFMAQLDRTSEPCEAYCRHPAIMDIARQVIGPDIDMTWNQAILKPPLPPEAKMKNNAFAWHQDMWYATHGDYAKDCNLDIMNHPTLGMTVWGAVSRTTVDNGTLWVLPGMHKQGLLPHVWSAETREWVGQFDTSYKVPVVMRPGQFIVFNKYLPHGSSANISNETRMAYQIGYNIPGLKLGPSPDLKPLLRGGVPV